MKIFACYERDFANRWQIVCYHGSMPPKSVNGQTVERSKETQVRDDEIDKDGNPMFRRIKDRFPPPVEAEAA